jgi:hypothetical protein
MFNLVDMSFVLFLAIPLLGLLMLPTMLTRPSLLKHTNNVVSNKRY